jgi:hypothetical protein
MSRLGSEDESSVVRLFVMHTGNQIDAKTLSQRLASDYADQTRRAASAQVALFESTEPEC